MLRTRKTAEPDEALADAGPEAARPEEAGSATRPDGLLRRGTAARRAATGPMARAARGRLAGGRPNIAWLAVLSIAVLLTAAGTAVALVGQHGQAARTTSATGGTARTGPGGNGFSAAAGVRGRAARWLAAEISSSAIIGCDTVMCTALETAGVPSASLLVLRPAAPDPLGADVIVATPVLRSQFGGRLATEYAPEVLASFGTGANRVDVRVVAADGAAAYQAALRQDVAARKRVGGQLLRNRRISMPSAATTDVAAGVVDPRLLVLLAALAHVHPVRVLGFYDQAPGSAFAVPLSGVRLSGADRQSGLAASDYQRWLLSFLQAQQSTYRPDSISATNANGRPVVAVRFARPNPLGLLHR